MWSQDVPLTENVAEIEYRGTKYNVNYTYWGEGGKNVLVIPGRIFGTWRTDFGEQWIKKFDPYSFRVIAVDPIGYGKSRPPDRDFAFGSKNHIRRDGRIFGQLMKDLEYHPYNVMGFDEGARTGMFMCAELGDDIIDSAVFWGAMVQVTKEMRDKCANMPGPETWPKEKLDQFLEMYDLEWMKKTYAEAMAYFVKAYDEWKGMLNKNMLDRMRQQILVIDPEHDEYEYLWPEYMLNETKFAIQKGVARTTYTRRKGPPEKATHFVHLDDQDWFLKETQKFIKGIIKYK